MASDVYEIRAKLVNTTTLDASLRHHQSPCCIDTRGLPGHVFAAQTSDSQFAGISAQISMHAERHHNRGLIYPEVLNFQVRSVHPN